MRLRRPTRRPSASAARRHGRRSRAGLRDTKSNAADKHDRDLTCDHDSVNAEKPIVLQDSLEDVESVVESSAIELVKNLHPNKRIEDNLATYFSTKVVLKHNSNGKGNITIEYYSKDELDKILELMQTHVD